MSQIMEPALLLRTSAATDVVCSGGLLTVGNAGSGVRKSRIYNITQFKGKAEVAQVKKFGYSGYTPYGSTEYTVLIGDTNRTRNGRQEQLKPYTYKTPTDITTLGATAALQREAIHLALAELINADNSNFVTAASLLTGTGVSITDDAGYYPAFSQTGTGRLGASTVRPKQNDDDSGFLSTDVTTTTAAVYAFGVGATLASSVPVVDALTGGLLSGYLNGAKEGYAPKTVSATPASNGLPCVSGQIYDAFVIEYYGDCPTYGGAVGTTALVPKVYPVFVDNGTGSSTANATGFVAFEREMLRHVFDVYAKDQSSQVDFFDSALVASSTYPTTGAAISTTDNVVMASKGASGITWYTNPIGTHTLLTPIVGTGGLQPYLDVTTQEGIEFSPPNLTQAPQEFVVGKQEGSFYARVTFGAIGATDWKTLSVGFRKKAAYATGQTAYEAASVATACLGVPLDTGVAPVINIITGPGAAGALTNTSTAVTPTAASTHELLVTVDINGVANFYVNGLNKTGLLAATYTFTAGLHLMPFISFSHGAGVSAAPAVTACAFVPAINWRG